MKDNKERWVVCLKHGNKYGADYVNRLYNMVKRHSSYSVGVACLTEDPTNINPDVKILPLPSSNDLHGWWYKPYVFSGSFPLTGTLLFMDLDVVLIKNIDCYWDFNPGKFCIIRDFTRSIVPTWSKFNSSIFRLESRSLAHVWQNLDRNILKRMHGDQDWIFDQVKEGFEFWPDDWCQSYKWEIRNKNEIIGFGKERKFNSIREPEINPNTSILVFHGDPKPEQVKDPIVVKNWC